VQKQETMQSNIIAPRELRSCYSFNDDMNPPFAVKVHSLTVRGSKVC